jgi:light-regulated signal transduction histidine kinase (bacteriophytochrome)
MSATTAGADQAALESTRSELARVRQDFGEFVYAASHDLAEPVAIVSGYTRLLARRYREELDADGQQFVDVILDAMARADDMIGDLRAFSRVGTRGGSFGPVNCERAATEAADLLGPAIERYHAKVDIGSLPTVRADQAQVVQLFRHLLSNALTFRSQDPPRIGIEAERDGLSWNFAVSDNGLGVPERDRERIFRMFERGDNPARSGNGAGLAIARRIVERHGGTIEVEAGPDGGSVFRFTIPEPGEGSE